MVRFVENASKSGGEERDSRDARDPVGAHPEVMTVALMTICLLGLVLAPSLVAAGESSETQHTDDIIILDDFDTWTYHWTPWVQRTGTNTSRDGTYHLGITDQSMGQYDSIAALHDYYRSSEGLKMPWLCKGIDVRLRCSDDNKLNSQTGGGTRCWGFADCVPFRIPPNNALCFWSGSPECGEGLRGLSAISSINSEIIYREPLTGIDITEWHTYSIHWEQNNATFLVDGEVVASTDIIPTMPMGGLILISNIVAADENWAMDLDANESTDIDYIRIYIADEDVFREESKDVTELLDQATYLHDALEAAGDSTADMKTRYHRAMNLWLQSNHLQAEDLLDDYIQGIGDYVAQTEITIPFPPHWSEAVNDTIRAAEREGRTRDALIMSGRLKAAQDLWDKGEYFRAKEEVEKIVQLPEPLILVLAMVALCTITAKKRSPGTRRSRLILAAFVLLVGTLHATAGQASTRQRLVAMLPEPYEGYVADRDPWFCVGMVNLTFIHNGGYLDWVDRGVQTALHQTYTKDSSFYTATLYTMNSEANASAILEHYRSTYQATATSLGDGGFEKAIYGMNYVHFYLGDLFITLEGTGQSSMEAMRKSAEDIVSKAVSEPLPLVMVFGAIAILMRIHHSRFTHP